MRHRTQILGIALVSTFVFAAGATAGPPWISVEYPANPHERTTRGALFLVHTFHHGTMIEGAVSASFEGLVDGQRRTITAAIERTHRNGVYAVRGAVPVDGRWVAVVRMQDGNAPAAAIVTLGASGAVLAIDVPADRNREGWYIPRAVDERDIDHALHAAAGLAAFDAGHSQNAPVPMSWAGALGLLLLCAGAVRVARTRNHS